MHNHRRFPTRDLSSKTFESLLVIPRHRQAGLIMASDSLNQDEQRYKGVCVSSGRKSWEIQALVRELNNRHF